MNVDRVYQDFFTSLMPTWTAVVWHNSLSDLRLYYAFADLVIHNQRVFRTDRYEERFYRVRKLAL